VVLEVHVQLLLLHEQLAASANLNIRHRGQCYDRFKKLFKRILVIIFFTLVDVF
jgi:hypothetical protein